mgnify:CR=1 FL=1
MEVVFRFQENIMMYSDIQVHEQLLNLQIVMNLILTDITPIKCSDDLSKEQF